MCSLHQTSTSGRRIGGCFAFVLNFHGNLNERRSTMAASFERIVNGRRPIVDAITPHKLTLVVVIREYLEIKGRKMLNMDVDEDAYLPPVTSIGFMFLMLDVMQGPDVELEELMVILSPVLTAKHMQNIEERTKQLVTGGVHEIMEYMDKLATPIIAEYTVLNRNSVAGLFVRSMISAFESMMFEHVVDLHDDYCIYYSKWKPVPKEYIYKRNTDKQPGGGFWSTKLAEQHLRHKAFLLEHCERAAGSPVEVRYEMVQLLKRNPSLTKTYFVDMLNTHRVKEYCTTMESLYHYFDSTSLTPGLSAPGSLGSAMMSRRPEDDANRSFRYAALTVAAVCARLGHSDQANRAVLEAIRMAQEAGDNVCLQHATSWLNWLNDQNASCPASHFDNAILRSNELNLQQLSSMGYLILAKQGATRKRPSSPSLVLQHIIQSDIATHHPGISGHSHIHVLTTGFIQKASLYQAYGCSGMASAFAQVLLALNTSVRGTYHMAEQECLALCLLATQHFDQGMYLEAEETLAKAKSEFPVGSQLSPLWMFTSLLHNFERAIHHCKYEIALHICEDISVINQIEGRFRRAVLYKLQSHYDKAVSAFQSLYDMCRVGRIRNSVEYSIRVLLELGSMYSEAGHHAEGLNYLLECSTLSRTHHRFHLHASAHLAIAKMQLMMGMPNKATPSTEKVLVFLYSNGSLYHQASALLLLARCYVSQAASFTRGSGSWRNALLVSLRMLSDAVQKLQKIEDYQLLREAYFLQAAVLNDLGYMEQRNEISQRIKKLSTTSSST